MTTVKEGSSLHYSLLWTDESARQRFINRLGLIKALSTTLEEVCEPEVAEQKIHWWHEEIQRLLAGEARHPACKPCQSALSGVAAAQAPCLAIISAASTLRFTPPTTNAESDLLITQSFTARLALLAHALSDFVDDLDIESHSTCAALALGKQEQLIRLPLLIHRGLPVFSDEAYKMFDIQASDLAAHIRVAPEKTDPAADDVHIKSSPLKRIPIVVEKPGRQALISSAIADSHEQLIKAVNNVPVTNRYRESPYLPIWRLLVLREKQLALWQHKQPDLLREITTLTPIVKLYTAWRHKR